MNKQKGFTFIELAFLLGLIAFLTFVMSALQSAQNQKVNMAVENLKDWADVNEVGEIKRMNCTGDIDNNGMASCRIITKASPGNVSRRLTVECPTKSLGQCSEALVEFRIRQAQD